MDYLIIIFIVVLLSCGAYTTISSEIIDGIDEILDRKFNALNDLSTCTGEINGLVNEASVLSISVEDIINHLKILERETEKEIQTYDYIKRNISEIDKLNKTENENLAGSDVPEIQIPKSLQSGLCFQNTWAKNYYDGSERGHDGLTWKSGKWQNTGRKKSGQLGLRLQGISLSSGYGISSISAVTVLEDGTIAATDRHNFVLSLFNLDGVKQKSIFFEPLQLRSVTAVPGQRRKVIVTARLLDNTDTKLLVDIDDESKVTLNEKAYAAVMSQSLASRTTTPTNCTVEPADTRLWNYRHFYRSPSGDLFYGTYGRKTVIQYDANCSYKGVFAEVKFRQQISGLTGIADLVMVQFDRGGRSLHDDRVMVLKIP